MRATRAETVRTQLGRTAVHWADAARELRELLIDLATEIDSLSQRVRDLEAERRGA
jgi:hypothetical protein